MFYLTTLTIALLIIAYILDKLYYNFSGKWADFIFHAVKFLIELVVQLTIIMVTQALIKEITDFDLFHYWNRIAKPIQTLIITAYLAFCIYKKYKYAKELNQYSFISSISRRYSYPTLFLNYVLLRANVWLDIYQKNLSLLKSFSPIPIALLVFNNFSDITFTNMDLRKFASSNTLNIILLVLLGIYVYSIIITSMRIKQQILIVLHIQEEIYAIENPYLFKEK